jgi:hypothetical protein
VESRTVESDIRARRPVKREWKQPLETGLAVLARTKEVQRGSSGVVRVLLTGTRG